MQKSIFLLVILNIKIGDSDSLSQEGDNMVLKKGKDIDELKDYLDRVENYEKGFKVKNIFSENQQIELKADVKLDENGKAIFHSWQITSKVEGKKKFNAKKSFTSVMNALEDVKFHNFNDAFATLCLYSVAPYKTDDGKFVTKWVQFDAGSPFWFDKNGNIQVYTERIMLNATELEYAKGNPIGLYDGNSIYLLSENALIDIARMYDAKGKKDFTSPIGAYSLRHFEYQGENFQRSVLPAMAIGDLLYNKKYDVNIIYKESGDSPIKMCLAIAGKFYRQTSTKKLFDKLLTDIACFTTYQYKEGFIDGIGSIIKIILNLPLIDENLEIEIVDSQLPGFSASFGAYYRFDKSRIFITGQALKHNDQLINMLEDEANIIGKDFFEEITSFISELSSPKKVKISKECLKPIISVIGKANSEKLLELSGKSIKKGEAIKSICEASYFSKYESLPEACKQTYDLMERKLA